MQITEKQKEEIKKQISKRKSPYSIARELGISYSGVCNWVKTFEGRCRYCGKKLKANEGTNCTVCAIKSRISDIESRLSKMERYFYKTLPKNETKTIRRN